MRKLLAGMMIAIGIGATLAPAAAQPRCRVVHVDDSQVASRPANLRSSQPRLLYLNRCIGGATFTPGFEDSRTNTSSIISFTGTLSEFPLDDEAWTRVVNETRDILAGYDLLVTDTDPGDQPHHEVAVCGFAQQVGFDPDEVGGVSPLRCRPIENSIAYVFPESFGTRTRRLAETVAHEAGHSFGLEHEFLCDEVMGYLDCYPQYYRDNDSQCGEYEARSCSCARFLQNSHQFLLQAFGPAPPTPPQITISAPGADEVVTPGFWVLVEIDDDQGMAWVKLIIDGRERASLQQPPYYLKSPTDLGDGRHQVEVRAQDWPGAVSSASVSVVIGAACTADSCAANQRCVGGRCLLGPGSAGGLGEPCGDDGACASGYCASDDAGDSRCSAFCVVGGDDCPSGFSCSEDSELGGACLMTPVGEEASGCRASATPPGLVFALAIVLFLGRGRRRW